MTVGLREIGWPRTITWYCRFVSFASVADVYPESYTASATRHQRYPKIQVSRVWFDSSPNARLIKIAFPATCRWRLGVTHKDFFVACCLHLRRRWSHLLLPVRIALRCTGRGIFQYIKLVQILNQRAFSFSAVFHLKNIY